MKTVNWFFKILVAISAITVVSGMTQLIKPDFILGMISGETTATSMHFFAIIGMFMVLFGGMLLQELFSAANQPIVAFWAAMQKFGASLAVVLGVFNQIFSPLALLVAGFDLLSGVLIMLYWIGGKPSNHS